MALRQQVLDAVAVVKSAVEDLAVEGILLSRGEAIHIPGTKPTYSESESGVKVVLGKFKEKEIEKDRTKASDLQGLIFPETGQPVPKANDVLQIGLMTYRVIDNDKVMAGSAVALSVVQLRIA